jgi:hypothetical protein
MSLSWLVAQRTIEQAVRMTHAEFMVLAERALAVEPTADATFRRPYPVSSPVGSGREAQEHEGAAGETTVGRGVEQQDTDEHQLV